MYSEPLITREIGPCQVIDGHIEFFDNEYGIKYRVKVTQKKSYGAVYADNITEPTPEHVEIINMMLSSPYMQTSKFTRQQLLSQLKLSRISYGINKEVKSSPFSARVSELVRKGILVKSTNKKIVTYHVNQDYAIKVRETRKF